jgi:hypothetical protein
MISDWSDDLADARAVCSYPSGADSASSSFLGDVKFNDCFRMFPTRSIQRKKSYASGLIIGPHGAKIDRFLGFVFRHIMAEA